MANRAEPDDDRLNFPAGLLLSPALPVRACRGPWRALGYWPSLGAHLLGLALFAVGLAVIDAWWDHGILHDLSRIEPEQFKWVALVALVWLAFIQAMFLLAAFLTVCWGAGVEPWGRSFGRSVRRWYQLTPFLALASVGFIFAINLIDEWWYRGMYSESRGVSYELIQFARLLSTGLYVGLTLGAALATLAIHTDTPCWHPRCRWPALCETCGYALVGLGVDHACPECGRPVRESLYTPRGSLRQGSLALMAMALFQPTRLGRHLLNYTPTPGPARALVLAALGLFFTGPTGIVVLALIDAVLGGYGEFYIYTASDFVRNVVYIGGFSGVFIALGGVFVVLGVGSLVATIDRMFGRRDLMPAARQAACYASGLLVGWSMLSFILGAVLGRIAEALADAGRYDLMDYLGLVLLAFQLAMLTFYLVLVGRVVWPARYANA